MAKPSKTRIKAQTKANNGTSPENSDKNPPGTVNPAPDNGTKEERGSTIGDPPLSTLPETVAAPEAVGEKPTAERVDNKPACSEVAANDTRDIEYTRVTALLNTLEELADDTHHRYDVLDGELQLALAWQERIAQQQDEVSSRIDAIRDRARANRLIFAQGLETTREVVASDLPGDPPARPTTGGPAGVTVPRIIYSPPEDDVVTYAALEESEEDPRFRLFRPRSPGERSVDYKRRLNEQTHLLAREHYEDGARKRNAKAEKLWQGMHGHDGADSARDIQASTYPRQYRRHRGSGPPDDDDDDGSSSNGDSHRPANRRDRGDSSRDRDRTPRNSPRGGTGGGRGGGGPPGGGPPSSPQDGDESDPSSDTHRRQRPPHMARQPTPRERTRGRSLSYLPEGRERDYFLAPTHDDPNAEYIDKQLEAIRAVIWERVSHELPDVPGMKNIKNIPAPEKYGGDDDSDMFMSWLRAFLRWLALGRITGSALDADRVQLLGQYLVKEARAWYDDAIDNLDGIGRDWTFEQALCALYRRFIHKSTARSAADRFHQVKYRRETGVSGLWDTMTSLARKMPELPNDYSFKTRFIDALPEEICTPMLRNHSISVERSDAWAIRRAALQQEENNRALDDWRTARRPAGQRESERTGRSGQDRNNASSRPGAAFITRPFRAQGAGAPLSSPAAVGQDRRGPTAGTTSGPPNQRANTTPQRTSTPFRTQTAGPGTTPRNAGSTPRTQCYNCREYGHMAAQCPKAQAPRLRAARVLDGGDHDTASGSPDGTAEELASSAYAPMEDSRADEVDREPRAAEDGDQPPSDDVLYESDEEYYDVDGSQYESDGMAAAFSDHGNDDAWFGSMRIVDDNEPSPTGGIAGSTPTLSADETTDSVVDSDANNHAVTIPPEASARYGFASDIIHPAIVPRPPPTVADEGDDEDSLPELEPMSDDDGVRYSRVIRYPGDGRVILRYTDDIVIVDSPAGGTVDESPIDADLDIAWTRFVDSTRHDEDLEQLLVVVYRMEAQNGHFRRSLYDSRNQTDALRESLAWTRRELAIALFREAEGSNGVRRTGRADGQRARIRARLLTEVNPLTLEDEDETDDPRPHIQLPEATELLLSVVEGRAVPPGTGVEPPEYEQVARADENVVWFGAMNASSPADNWITWARSGRRPLLSAGEQECIVLLLTINGLGALTLFDAGSTTEMLSNDFARVSQCDVIKLENPATLQLGCAGSRSRIIFGTRAPMTLGSFGADVYFDIANLDRYDAVLGTPFLRRFGVLLDFKNNCVVIDGQSHPAMSRAQVNDVLAKRMAKAIARERPQTSRLSPAPNSAGPSH